MYLHKVKSLRQKNSFHKSRISSSNNKNDDDDDDNNNNNNNNNNNKSYSNK